MAISLGLGEVSEEIDMGKLVFEQIDDVRAVHPYLFVYLLEDHETFQVGRGHPFMRIEVTREQKLQFAFYPIDREIVLNEEHWERVLVVAREFLEETIQSGDDW
ncbi:hypothetical protein QYH69_13030 [Paraburkholderia sp. SARCC-3016]|jgi:hypothetical protein|uniref:hypothetical protein n=1 Tax=Paraburkholderia sp. SARCC-3016 TaxID=3058611 RepID=UPI00280891D6|nr:hypothetical protein [Paraburkholderia sp. SARCC-3016]MDQ7978167.1 hypothetical protein [Paraburkholderia sp. SARCC-3016]